MPVYTTVSLGASVVFLSVGMGLCACVYDSVFGCISLSVCVFVCLFLCVSEKEEEQVRARMQETGKERGLDKKSRKEVLDMNGCNIFPCPFHVCVIYMHSCLDISVYINCAIFEPHSHPQARQFFNDGHVCVCRQRLHL